MGLLADGYGLGGLMIGFRTLFLWLWSVLLMNGAFSAANAENRYQLSIALPFPGNPPICCMAIPAAKDLGYYDRQGLDVEFVNVGTASTGTVQLLAAKRIDVGTAAVAAGFGAFAAGAKDIRFFGAELNNNFTLSGLKWVYAAKTEINSVQDLKGKTIGLPAGPNPTDPVYVQISALLADNGLSDRDVRWTVAGTQALRAQALMAGRIDFTQVPMELSYLMTPENGVHMVSFEPVGASKGWTGCQCWFANESVLNDPEKREAVQRFVNGTILAMRDMAHDREIFTKAMSLYIDMSRKTPESIDAVWNYERLRMQPNGGVNLEHMQRWFESVYLPDINPRAKGRLTLKEIVDTSFLETFHAKYGTDEEAYWDPPHFAPQNTP